MWAWPNLVLTDYEKKFVRIYKTAKYPGVLKRVYRIQLNNFVDVNQRLPTIQLRDQIQIARRSRVFGLTLQGNLDQWRLRITNASGTIYTVQTPARPNSTGGGGNDPIVSSMVPSTFHNVLSLGGLVPPLAAGLSDGIGPYAGTSPQFPGGQHEPAPLLIDPNWLLLPNETLIFDGTPLPIEYNNGQDDVETPLVLTVCVHVWEFPRMGVAPAKEREVL